MPLDHMHEQLHLRHPKRSFVQYRLEKPGFITPIVESNVTSLTSVKTVGGGFDACESG